jgi:hypothetical protein
MLSVWMQPPKPAAVEITVPDDAGHVVDVDKATD